MCICQFWEPVVMRKRLLIYSRASQWMSNLRIAYHFITAILWIQIMVWLGGGASKIKLDFISFCSIECAEVINEVKRCQLGFWFWLSKNNIKDIKYAKVQVLLKKMIVLVHLSVFPGKDVFVMNSFGTRKLLIYIWDLDMICESIIYLGGVGARTPTSLWYIVWTYATGMVKVTFIWDHDH